MDVDAARREWADGFGRFREETAEPQAAAALHAQLALLGGELRRRVGSTFTLAELADAYGDAESWARAALQERDAPGWPRTLADVLDAAFYLYSRGAADYRP